MDSLEARELLFLKMNDQTAIDSTIVREAITLLNEQREEINKLKEIVRIYNLSDQLVKEHSSKIKHLFPLENTVGYGQLCERILELTKENGNANKEA